MKKISICSQVREREQDSEKNLSEILASLQDANVVPVVKIKSKDFETEIKFEGLEKLVESQEGIKILSKLFTPVKVYYENRIVDYPLNGDSYLKSLYVEITL